MLGCDNSQGYYLGRPMPVEKLEAWLRAWSGVSTNAPAAR
jgi:EAL domain-containing protein (putative c-di-GMP-specific phosphodiesterase class I)